MQWSPEQGYPNMIFFMGFVGNIKESTFMVEIFRKKFHGSQDLMMKVAV